MRASLRYTRNTETSEEEANEPGAGQIVSDPTDSKHTACSGCWFCCCREEYYTK